MPERRSATEPKILLADPDPYLAFLIRQEFPKVRIEEAFGSGGVHVPSSAPDLVIADVDDPSEMVGMYGGTNVIGVVDATKLPGTLTQDSSRLLVRPFLPSEVHRTVRSALGLPAHEQLDWPVARLRTTLAAARVASVVAAAGIEIAMRGGTHLLLLTLVAAFSIGRLVVRAGRIVATADLCVAAAAIVASGGVHSAYAPFGLIAVLGCGFELGATPGAAAGLFIASTGVASIVAALRNGTLSSMEVAAWFVFFVLGGFAGGILTRTGVGGRSGAAMLAEANVVLSNLYRIARAMPGGLEPTIIADSVVSEIREVTAAPAAVMLVRQVGTYAVASSYGLVQPQALAGSQWENGLSDVLDHASIFSRDRLPPATAVAWSLFPCLIAAPIRRDASTFGLLIIACPDHALHARNKAFIERLARESAVAVENSELFARVREMSIDEERQRLARDLHDGVAQAITHLRLELDLLARDQNANAGFREDLTRLGRVVQRAGTDVREMILGLRSPVATEGLLSAIRSYIRDLRRFGGPEIEFNSGGVLRPSPEVEAEVFRVVQEALSNALRHAQAHRIQVNLSIGVDELRLTIEDDGIGFDAHRSYEGVGLFAMRERAGRIGGTLSVKPREDGGTTVDLYCPIKQEEAV